jgi:TetR/AcrR family transcriptional regulator, transcriptional repressor for nem operon
MGSRWRVASSTNTPAVARTGRDGPAPTSARTRRSARGTRARILDVAERLVQVRGYGGFSYADVAGELGLTKASLHYHFRGKAALGEALVTRYSERVRGSLREIDARGERAPAKLRAYTHLFADVLREGRMCMCGMLAAELRTLPTPLQELVVRFLDDNETWLERVLREGRVGGDLRFEGSAREVARSILAGLQGAMLIAFAHGDVARFEKSAPWTITQLAGTADADADARAPRARIK